MFFGEDEVVLDVADQVGSQQEHGVAPEEQHCHSERSVALEVADRHFIERADQHPVQRFAVDDEAHEMLQDVGYH